MAYYRSGVNMQHIWPGGPPGGLSDCPKLKEGQLLMHRYRLTYDMYKDDERYKHISVSGKEKSVILAKRMRDHADQCPNCSQTDEDFYGLIRWG